MADSTGITNTSVQGGASALQGTTNAGTGEKTFSQADVDRVVADLLAREQKKYADYNDLKAVKEELDQLKGGQKSELEMANAAREKAEANWKQRRIPIISACCSKYRLNTAYLRL